MESKFSKGTNFFAKEKEAAIRKRDDIEARMARSQKETDSTRGEAGEAIKTRQDAIVSGHSVASEGDATGREKLVPVTGYVPESMKNDLKIYTGATGQSISEIFRRLLEKELSANDFLNAYSKLKH